MAASSSLLGMTPASLSLVAFTNTMTLIGMLLWFLRSTCPKDAPESARSTSYERIFRPAEGCRDGAPLAWKLARNEEVKLRFRQIGLRPKPSRAMQELARNQHLNPRIKNTGSACQLRWALIAAQVVDHDRSRQLIRTRAKKLPAPLSNHRVPH